MRNQRGFEDINEHRAGAWHSMLTGAVDVLADFGISPPKQRTVSSAAKKVQTVKKAKATRVAR